jgi:hypothetical protein
MNNDLNPDQIERIKVEAARLNSLSPDNLKQQYLDLVHLMVGQDAEIKGVKLSVFDYCLAITNAFSLFESAKTPYQRIDLTLKMQTKILIQDNQLKNADKKND